jgi:hypothetical protein
MEAEHFPKFSCRVNLLNFGIFLTDATNLYSVLPSVCNNYSGSIECEIAASNIFEIYPVVLKRSCIACSSSGIFSGKSNFLDL